MIIETDFPDHWKTQLLIKLTGSDAAPMLMIRFWAFCQQRRAWRFPNLSSEALAAICRWSGDAAKLRTCLLEAGFLVEEQGDDGKSYLVAHDFDRVHSTYVANWKNGALGGRPKTQSKPDENPNGSLGKPSGEERRGRLGEDGLERNTPLPPPAGGSRKRVARSAKAATPSTLPVNEPDPKRTRMLALNAIFRRPPTDAWSATEQAALADSRLLDMHDSDFAEACETVRAFYHANIPREMQKKYWHRTTLDKLLENWGGELDKARTWAREKDDGVRKVS